MERKAPYDAGAPSPLIARAYIRVSDVAGRGKEGSKEEFISPGEQADAARSYAAAFGMRFDEAASASGADVGQSAFRKHYSKRPGIMGHLAAARRGDFQVLIVYKLSRLARSAREGLELFDAFESAGVSVHCVKERIDSASPVGRLLRTVLLAVAEMQAEDIREWAQASARRRAKRGLPAGNVPAWIRKAPDGGSGGAHEIDERHAPAYRRMVELRLSHLGYARIARALNAEGLRMPSGGRWTAGAICSKLSGEALERLAGIAVWHLHGGAVVRVPDAYPALVEDGEEMEALRRMSRTLAAGRRLTRGPGGPGRGPSLDTSYLLSSRLCCSVCGARMSSGTASTDGVSVRTYRCHQGHTDASRHPDGRGLVVRADVIEDAVLRALRYAIAAASAAAHTHAPARSGRKRPKPPPPRAAATADTPDSVRARMSELVSLLLAGRIRREVYDEHYTALETALEAAERHITEADAPDLLESAAAALSAGSVRAAVLALVDRIEYPVYLAGQAHRNQSARKEPGRPRRCARITLRALTPAGREVIAPAYRSHFAGRRLLFSPDGQQIDIP